jgi:hypothetical protein
MLLYLSAIGVFFVLLCSLVLVTRHYRKFAADNPELGPFRDADKCMGCVVSEKKCSKKKS